ncbi:MAG: hypothetical protein RLZZ627_604 [Pseudomonadota bacterium]|jgi:hypothetical protein
MRSYFLWALAAMCAMSFECHAAPTEPSTPPPPPGLMMNDEGLRERQDHLLKMHELSNRILSAKDPKEKERLKDEQLQLMKSYELKHHEMMQRHMKDMMNKKPKP